MRSLLIFSFRIELAVKDAFKQTEFKEVDENYIGIFNLFKHSGKVKGEVAAANKALNIQHYELSKLTGTRFVGHRRTGFSHFLAILPGNIIFLYIYGHDDDLSPLCKYLLSIY